MSRGLIPPQNIEAEQAILGIMMLSPEAVTVAMTEITADAFCRQWHQVIFSAMSELFASGQSVDLVTTIERLIGDRKLDSAGGAAYVSGLTEVIPMAGKVREYCLIVKEKARARNVIELANRMRSRCYAGEPMAYITEDFGNDFFRIVADKTAHARPVSVIADEVFSEIEDVVNNGRCFGLMTGFYDLDRKWNGLQPGELTIIAARPAMGKTCLAINIGCNCASKGAKVLVYSLEMRDRSLVRRMMSAFSRVSGDAIRKGFITEDQVAHLGATRDRMKRLPMHIDHSAGLSITELMARAKLQKLKGGLDLIIVDYIQLLWAKAENRTQEISTISRNLKVLAKDLDVPVVALSQLNRSLESRTDKRPMMSDLRESGAIEQDADVVVFIYRDDYYNPSENNPARGQSEIITAKQRNGPTGVDRLLFNGELSVFENMEARHG